MKRFENFVFLLLCYFKIGANFTSSKLIYVSFISQILSSGKNFLLKRSFKFYLKIIYSSSRVLCSSPHGITFAISLESMDPGLFNKWFFFPNDFLSINSQICLFDSSMQPLINSGEQKNFVFIVRPLSLTWLLFGQPPEMERLIKRGDVVSLISPKNPRECFLKRVVGLPGDLVKTINYKKKYVLVPKGHCWIEGKNMIVKFFNNFVWIFNIQ